MTDLSDDPVLTVRRHPDYLAGDPRALRVVRVDVAHPGEWPWRRVTGLGTVPQDTDLTDWPVEPLGDLAADLGHRVVLTGQEITRR